jgi:hypothetical protein
MTTKYGRRGARLVTCPEESRIPRSKDIKTKEPQSNKFLPNLDSNDQPNEFCKDDSELSKCQIFITKSRGSMMPL